jgi:hypothetical protein
MVRVTRRFLSLWRLVNPLRLIWSAYSTLPTVSAGEVISSSGWGNLVKADIEYLFNRPADVDKVDNAASYTTTSTSFTDINATNLGITMTVASGKVLLLFTGVVSMTGGTTRFDFDIDGTRYCSAGTDGLAGLTSVNAATVSMCALVTGLSAGSHTFKVKWWVTSGQTATLYAGNGVAAQDWIPSFAAIEVG